MSNNLVDSSVIIAFFRKKEEKHEEAKKLLSNLNSFSITDFVLAEVATVLRMKEPLNLVVRAVNLLKWNYGVEVIRLNDEEFDMATHFFLRSKKKISFVDATLAVLSKSKKLNLLTFDEDLLKCLTKA